MIGDRAFGADPGLVADMGQATIGGLQDNMVVACGKHFRPWRYLDRLAQGTSGGGCGTSTVTTRSFPFQQAIRFGVASLMTAHVLYRALDPDAPATLSPAVIQRLLREEFRYDGVGLHRRPGDARDYRS